MKAAGGLALIALIVGCSQHSKDDVAQKQPAPEPANGPMKELVAPPAPEAKAVRVKFARPDQLLYRPLDPRDPSGPAVAVVFDTLEAGEITALFMRIPAGTKVTSTDTPLRIVARRPRQALQKVTSHASTRPLTAARWATTHQVLGQTPSTGNSTMATIQECPC